MRISLPVVHVCYLHTAILVCLTSRLTRVRVSATVLALEAIVQWINLVFYLAPNVYVLRNPCNILTAAVYTSGFVQWSCWNTVSLPTLLLVYMHTYL